MTFNAINSYTLSDQAVPTRHLPRNNAPLNLRRSHEKSSRGTRVPGSCPRSVSEQFTNPEEVLRIRATAQDQHG